jgi:hypothetical protein
MVDNSNFQDNQEPPRQQLKQFYTDKSHHFRPENMTILNDKSSISSISSKNLSSDTSSASFKWSSNISVKGVFLNVESNINGRRQTIDVTDTEEETTIYSGKSKSNFFLTKSNENLRIQEQTDRPMTARSLPAKVENEENKILFNQHAIIQHNRLASTGTNSSYPLLSSSQVKLIQVMSSNDEEKNDDIAFETNFQENDYIETIPNYAIKSKDEKRIGTKSNLDKYLDYTLSPFTTKFEIIGNVFLLDFYLHIQSIADLL